MAERYVPAYVGELATLAAVITAVGGTVRVDTALIESARDLVVNRVEDPATLSTIFQIADHTHHYVPKATGERWHGEPTYLLRCEACGIGEAQIREAANG